MELLIISPFFLKNLDLDDELELRSLYVLKRKSDWIGVFHMRNPPP